MHAESAYLFRHALVREAAYQLQPPADRAELHAHTLRVLQADPGTAAADLAEHAGMAQQAQQRVIAGDELARAQHRYLRAAADDARAAFQHERTIAFLSELVAHPLATTAEVEAAHDDIATACISLGNFSGAIAKYKQIADFSPDPSLRAAKLLRAAQLHWNLGALHDAKQLLEEAQGQIAQFGLSQLEPQMNEAIALIEHHAQGENARELLETAVAGARNAGDAVTLGKVLDTLARHFRNRDDFGKALRCIDEADHLGGSRKLRLSRGNVLWRMGRLDEAEAEYQQELKFAREHGDLSGVAIVRGNLANIHLARHQYERAEEMLHSSLASCREMGLTSHAATQLMTLGNIRYYQDDFEGALHFYCEAERLHARADAPENRSSVLANIGLALEGLGRYDEALARFQQAVDLAARTGNTAAQASHMARFHYSLKQLGRLQQARDALLTALSLHAKNGAPETPLQFSWWTELAISELELGLRPAAVASAAQARECATRLQLPHRHSTKSVLGALERLAALESSLGLPQS